MSEQWIPLSIPDLTTAEREAVADAVLVVAEGRVVSSAIDAFEAAVADASGTRRGLALSSGTAALHLGLVHLGARPGTMVLTSSMTFAATANAIRYTGAEPVFIDSCREDANVDVDLLLHAADELRAQGHEVVAAVPVDLFGRCADYGALEPALAERGIPLFCDAAESFGAHHRGRPSGSFGAASAISFNTNKIMTTLGGGMLVSDDDALIAHAHKLAHQAREPVPWYQHTEVGFNYRMSNITAGLGLGQLARFPDLLAGRRRVRELYAAAFAARDDIRILGRTSGDHEDNCWLTTIVVAGGQFDPMVAIDALKKDGIEARHLWKPMHLQPIFSDARSYRTGVADELFATGLNLPSTSSLTDQQVHTVADAVLRAVDAQ